MTGAQLWAALEQVIDPELGDNVVDLGMVRSASQADDGRVEVTLALTTAGCPLRAQLNKAGESQGYHAVRKVSDANVRYTTFARQTGARLRVTSPQPPSFRQRIATAQERDECLLRLLPNSWPAFTTMRGC